MEYQEMKKLLEEYGQEHVLQSYERLDETGKEKLLCQIEAIDFDECRKLYELTKKKKEFKDINLEPIRATVAEELSYEEIKRISFKGEKLIREGKFAVVMMAGRTRNKTWTFWSKRNV